MILCIILSANDSHIQAMTRTHRSKYREEILQCLQEHEEKRAGAQEIYAWLKEKGSDINLATVYRNLERLYEENQIRRVRMIGEEEMMYQVNKPDQSCSNHLHLYDSFHDSKNRLYFLQFPYPSFHHPNDLP